MIKAIVAVSEDWSIGYKGDLLCYLPKDLKRFKEITQNNAVIMGRKTLESLPNGEPLKDRYNIVLTRDANFRKKDTLVMHSIQHLLAYTCLLEVINGLDIYVIGGGEIYEQLLPEIDTIYVTKINHRFNKADTYFPNLDKMKEWNVVEESEIHNEGGLEYKFMTYKRINK
ncbi:dihydrofolate reductase [Tissierella praeacuta]|uniref:dihydrofolate reductase n=1 Tax=Tissierella praeacuta TaxID=43131 RepID=UPI003DA368BD